MLAWHAYLVLLILLGLLFLGGVVLALRWAIRDGQFRNLERGATVVFDDDEEPEGVHTDFFPGRRNKDAAKLDTRAEATGPTHSKS